MLIVQTMDDGRWSGDGVRLVPIVSVQIRGAEEAAVGATLVVALPADHRYPGWRTRLGVLRWYATNTGLSREGDHKGRPYRCAYSPLI